MADNSIFNKQNRFNAIKKLALKRGGICLSKEYVNAHHKLKFECSKGHIWFATPNSIWRRGTWCNMCKTSIGEDICRYVLEKAFNKSFNKSRPDWLLNKSGYKLELDGYNDDLKIAFEYQGEQHYNPVKFYGKEKNAFEKQKQRDKIKSITCKKYGIILLVIPSFKEMNNKFILDTISRELKRKGFDSSILNRIDINNFYAVRPKNKNHNDISNIVNNKGGKLLTIINSVNDYAEFECEHGHKFKTKASHIKAGSWCRFCGYKKGSSKKLKSIDEAHELAKKHGGKCLSKEYLGSRKRHLFECKNGHKFMRYINELRLNGDKCWCKKCNVK